MDTKTAILVIDMQNDFCSSDGSIARRGADVSPNQELAARLPSFLNIARAAGALIVWVRQESSESHVSDARRARSQAMGWSATDVALEGTWGAELYDNLHPDPNDAIIIKNKYSAFIGTPLSNLLRARGRNTVVVCGTATNVCVDSTVRSAYMEEFNVLLPTDLVASTRADLAAASIQNLGIYFCNLTTSAELAATAQQTA